MSVARAVGKIDQTHSDSFPDAGVFAPHSMMAVSVRWLVATVTITLAVAQSPWLIPCQLHPADP